MTTASVVKADIEGLMNKQKTRIENANKRS